VSVVEKELVKVAVVVGWLAVKSLDILYAEADTFACKVSNTIVNRTFK
jgi:hypothetical protein